MKFTAAVLLFFVSLTTTAQTNVKLLIGTYTNGKSEGIYVYDFNTTNAESKIISSIKTSNPSFLTISPNKKFVYAVNEEGDSLNNGGAVSAFSFDKSKSQLKFINQQKTGGNHPCYVTIDKTGKWLFVANYSGGSFAELPVKAGGSLAKATVEQFKGKGANPERQEAPHAHTTVLTGDNKYLMVTDLGRDKILMYPFNAATGALAKNKLTATNVIGGSGPRHLAVAPSQKYVYATQELNGTIAGFAVMPGGKLKLLQTISAVPEGYTGSFGGADIHVSPDGKFLYASNRGESNTIAVFSIDKATGVVKAIGYQPTGGVKPRNFNFDPSGNFLLVANQDTDNIVIFSIDHKTGLLKDTGKSIQVPAPVCIQWIR